MKRIILGLLSGIIFLTACGQTQPFDTAQDRPTPAPLIQNATFTPSPLPTNTSTSIPTETPTASITPTLSEFIQSNPFPTESLNPTDRKSVV